MKQVEKEIKIDCNYLNHIINDKSRDLTIIPVSNALDKTRFNSGYKRKDYIPGTNFLEYKPNGESRSYGTVRFNDEYGIEFSKNGKLVTSSPTSGLSHELMHLIHTTYDYRTNKIYNDGHGNGENIMEESATTRDTNRTNSILGEETRIDYYAPTKNVKMNNPTINKKN